MNDLSEQDLRFRILRLLDGELDQAEVEQLDAELRKDSEARRLYLEYAQLHSALESRCASRSQIGQSSLFSMEKLLARQRRRMMQGALLAAAAIVVISLATLWLMVAQRRPTTLARFEVAPNSDFSLTHSGDAPESRSNILRAGSRLRLTTGVMEGKFASGVRFVVEAPCNLDVLSEGRIAMSEGSGWFEVPSSAAGFTVDTGRLEVVDLGTRFGIVARNGKGHEIHVAKGSVEVSPSGKGDGKNKLVLKAGQARRLEGEGMLTEMPLNSSRFTTTLPEVPILKNAGFESLEKKPGNHNSVGYGPIPNWGTSGGTVGSSDISQPFLEQPAHSGERVAFIQNNGAIAQSVTGFDPAKLYTVTYFANERGLSGAATRTSVSLDLGTSFYTHPHLIAKTDAFRRIVSGPLHVYGPAANIEIRAHDHIGDGALLMDSVSLSRAVPAIPDGGFENPVLALHGFRQANGAGGGDLSGSAWKFSYGGGTTANLSEFAPPTAPEGSQAAVLQNQGAVIETTVTGFEPGVTYRLHLEAAGRTGGAAALRVILGGKPLIFRDSETLIPAVGSYQSFTSADFQATSDTLPLHIHSTSEGTTFLDDLRFEFVAEAEPTP